MQFRGLFSGDSSHVFFHMVVMYLWMLGFKSEGGVRQGCMSALCAALAALSCRSIGSLVARDADIAWQPAEVNVKVRRCESSLAMLSNLVLRWSSAWRHDMESGKIKNFFLLESSMHSRASIIAGASAIKMKL